MKTFLDEVVSKADGTWHRATIMQCADCDGLTFGLYVVEGQDHVHVQCVQCGTCYCQVDSCHESPEGVRAADAMTRGRLDEVACGDPGCDHGKHGPHFLHAKCHVRAGLEASYVHCSGLLELRCIVCKQPVTRIKVAFV